MIRSLYAGVSGMRNHQVRMDVIGNNIANVNAFGFKGARATFQDTLSQTLKGAGGGRNAIQVGTGMSLATVGINMEQGPLQMTGRNLDIAINGEGFFMVQANVDGAPSGTVYYTRDGNFYLNDQGYLVTADGYFVVSGDGEAIQVRLPDNPAITSLNVEQNGRVVVNGEERGNIRLATFSNPEGLERVGKNLFRATAASGEGGGVENPRTPGEEGVGTLEAGYLEMSNTDLSDEFTTMITTQRGYQANARIITVSDTLLEELINLKR